MRPLQNQRRCVFHLIFFEMSVGKSQQRKEETVTIDEEFQKLIPPLTDDEYRQLEENCIKEGIREAILSHSCVGQR